MPRSVQSSWLSSSFPSRFSRQQDLTSGATRHSRPCPFQRTSPSEFLFRLMAIAAYHARPNRSRAPMTCYSPVLFYFWHVGHQKVERPFWVKRLTIPLQPPLWHFSPSRS